MRQVGQHVTRLVDSRLSAGTDQLGEQLVQNSSIFENYLTFLIS